ncbi:MAG: tRNA 4-thiouridine(8) synthase ThiI [Oscillospiraceae bacterium]|nr:tRNA 4-thiouridine(8) synthase ThiI [Oscillospiraceae bacterium]
MEIIMAKYGEIALKGLNKRTFENILIKNIKKTLADLGEFNYDRIQSTLYIEPKGKGNVDLDETVARLSKVFGLAAIQKCKVLPKDFNAIIKDGMPYLEKSLNHAKSFKVEAKRSDKTFPMNTPQIQKELGGEILNAFPHLKVDVHNPEVVILLEIRDKAAYLNPERITGAGGIPVGSSGASLLMLSGGLDSPVAAYMIAKRGLRIDALHFQSPPYTSERALMKVESLCAALKSYLINTRLHCVEFTEVQEAIRDNCPEEYSTVVLRRMMIKAANLLYRQKLERGNNVYGGLITGECLGQVASQTLSAIACTDAAAELPVLRPLIGMDKTEIIAIARKIGTFDISVLPYEDCCTVFTPKHPKTNPKLKDVENIESRFDYYKLVTNAVNKAQIKDF